LTLNMLTPAAVIGPGQHLIVTYQTQLDPNSQNGAQLTNVAGATQWFSAPSSSTGRQAFTCTLTNGHRVSLTARMRIRLPCAVAVTITKQVSVVGAVRRCRCAARLPGARHQYVDETCEPGGDYGRPERGGGRSAHLRDRLGDP